MRIALTGVAVVGLLVAAGVPALLGAPGPWRTSGPEIPRAKLGQGRTLATWKSPDGKYELLERGTGRYGDFSWYRLFLRQGKRTTQVGSYQEIRDVKWLPDSSAVRYRGRKAVAPDRAHEVEVEYSPARRQLRWRLLQVYEIRRRPTNGR